ncbi:MAG: hypothetical protein QG597_4790, partial [Actinomycetota bacterium]|nr:hypothetical protein [Actinomycetota bacterium]
GDRTKQQGNDFSKIQARFATRVKLTSADVEEVIRKRLLEKNSAGDAVLRPIYAAQSANVKTLFTFVDGAKTYSNYSDEDHFIGTYPFVSYQFPLFQAAIEGISDHNVFEGRNSSVGERSMLAVVQQVVKGIGDVEVGTLATFDQMFAGIRASLKSAAQRSIDVAERNLDNKLAVRLLKALFLVKYVESFRATARNLTVLVYDRFGLDLLDLSRRVTEALALLEAETYVQRSGNAYEYLTNEEQVIEEEIKNVDIDSVEISARLFRILSGDVVKATKVRYAKNGRDFAFGYKLDDQVHGLQRELTLHFITPEYAYGSVEIRMHSAGKDELRVVLEPDDRAMADLRLLLKTEKYTKRKQTSSLSAVEDQILRSKAALNVEREKELIERIRASVGKAELVINATDVTSGSQEARTRVEDGLGELVTRTYVNLGMLAGVVYREQDIAGYANPDSSMIFDEPAAHRLAPAGDEVLSWVLRRDKLGQQVTVKSIIDDFQTKPYGWDLASIEVVIAWLVGNSKVTLTVDGNALKRSEVAAVLRNTQKHSRAVVAPQKDFDERRVKALRDFCSGFFDEASPPKDPLELARHGSERLHARHAELQALSTGSKYPFVAQLAGPIALLEQVVGKPAEWYLTDFGGQRNDLMEAKENLIDPIQGFLNGGQRVIYDDAETLLVANGNNLGYLVDGADAEVKRLLEDPDAFRGNKMAHLKKEAAALPSQVQQAVAASRDELVGVIEGRKAEILGSEYYLEATPEAQASVIAAIDRLVEHVQTQHQIALIREAGNTFEEATYPALLDHLVASVKPVRHDGGDPGPPAFPVRIISIKSIKVPGVHGVLATPGDVRKYTDALRDALIAALDNGKRISL